MSESPARKQNSVEEQIVVFSLCGQSYGVDVNVVREIIRARSVTGVPRSPDFVEGVINLRGSVIPVIDMAKRFGRRSSVISDSTRIIIVEFNGVCVGLTVDGVTEVLRVPPEAVERTPEVVKGEETKYLRGIALLGERMILLLNLDFLFYDEEKKILKEFEDAGLDSTG